ncbi:MAG: hypothetical protein JXM68_01750 [Sedimentisphaerales bacterium]|nr:hypothetical protein [Sedimentisphaerales bacterium]
MFTAQLKYIQSAAQNKANSGCCAYAARADQAGGDCKAFLFSFSCSTAQLSPALGPLARGVLTLTRAEFASGNC